MKKANKYLTLLTIDAVAMIILATLTTATFAWFTANREVETEKVTARSGSTNLELQLSKNNGSAFSAEMETDTDGTVYETETTYSIVKLETLGNKKLMPVSTADLTTFIYSPITEDDGATEITLKVMPKDVIPDEIYHDTIYIKLEDNDSMPDGTKANLYLDNLKKLPILTLPDGGNLGKAARLGLKISQENQTAATVIFRFEEDTKGAVSNTILNGEQLKPGLVLVEKDGKVAPSDTDPAALLKEYQYAEDNPSPKPLLTMELGTIYTMDIYFYLEGCDPDCDGSAERSTGTLALAFYAALV